MMVRLGKWLYQFRGFLPVPVFALAFLAAEPTPLSFLAGVAVASLGEAGRLWALTYIGPKSRAERKTRASRLIREGPYSLVRNPLYVANMLIILGVLVAAGRGVLLFLLPLLLVYYLLVARAEEAFLLEAFPEEAPGYIREVRAYLPRLRRPAPGLERFPLSRCILPELNTITALELCLGLVGLKLFVDLFVLLPLNDALFPL